MPTITAPAASSRSTAAASKSGTQPARIFDPAVVVVPAIASRSLTATGTPCSGPRYAPEASSCSARRALARARSARTSWKAFSSGGNGSGDGESFEGVERLGVEIVARPPGKRQQTLSLLSGGERTLTAAALLFAILKVNPSPFCVLDEVDAALDEANVGRFREALLDLGQQTQFLLVTHNRGTIEAADTIYGVSMGEDGASKILSLRLEELVED